MAIINPDGLIIIIIIIFRESDDLCGINIQGHNINNLRYADDTALKASNADDLQNIVTQVETASSKAVLDVNVKRLR